MTREPKEGTAGANDDPLGTKRSPGSSKPEDGIGQITQQFVQETDSLAETLPLANLSIESAYKHAHEQFRSFLETQSERRKDAEGRVVIRIRSDDSLKF